VLVRHPAGVNFKAIPTMLSFLIQTAVVAFSVILFGIVVLVLGCCFLTAHRPTPSPDDRSDDVPFRQ
jgi:hypothetical protein